MNNLILFDKSLEIYKSIPQYADIIINSIIAKSLNDGTLIKEASNFLSTEDLKKLALKLDIKIEILEKPKNKIYKVSKKDFISLTEKENIENNKFNGFDDFD